MYTYNVHSYMYSRTLTSIEVRGVALLHIILRLIRARVWMGVCVWGENGGRHLVHITNGWCME